MSSQITRLKAKDHQTIYRFKFDYVAAQIELQKALLQSVFIQELIHIR